MWASDSPFAHARSIRANSGADGKSCIDAMPRDAPGSLVAQRPHPVARKFPLDVVVAPAE
jgi:hypothetical protein